MTASTLAINDRKPYCMLRWATSSSRLRRLVRAMTYVVTVAGLGAIWGWRTGPAPPAVLDLTIEQRAALYQHSRANLELACEPRSVPGLERYCQEQARLLMYLPECDETCTVLVQNQLGWPTR